MQPFVYLVTRTRKYKHMMLTYTEFQSIDRSLINLQDGANCLQEPAQSCTRADIALCRIVNLHQD